MESWSSTNKGINYASSKAILMQSEKYAYRREKLQKIAWEEPKTLAPERDIDVEIST